MPSDDNDDEHNNSSTGIQMNGDAKDPSPRAKRARKRGVEDETVSKKTQPETKRRRTPRGADKGASKNAFDDGAKSQQQEVIDMLHDSDHDDNENEMATQDAGDVGQESEVILPAAASGAAQQRPSPVSNHQTSDFATASSTDQQMHGDDGSSEKKMPATSVGGVAVQQRSEVNDHSTTTAFGVNRSTQFADDRQHAPAASSSRIPPVTGLKVPSQQTPGKVLHETARLPRRENELPVPSMRLVLDHNLPLHPVADIQQRQVNGGTLSSTTSSRQPRNVSRAEPAEVIDLMDKDDDSVQDENLVAERSPVGWLGRPGIWFALLLLIQIPYFRFFRPPTVLIGRNRSLIAAYKRVFGAAAPVTAVPTPVNTTLATPTSTLLAEKVNQSLAELMNTSATSKQQQANQSLAELMNTSGAVEQRDNQSLAELMNTSGTVEQRVNQSLAELMNTSGTVEQQVNQSLVINASVMPGQLPLTNTSVASQPPPPPRVVVVRKVVQKVVIKKVKKVKEKKPKVKKERTPKVKKEKKPKIKKIKPPRPPPDNSAQEEEEKLEVQGIQAKIRSVEDFRVRLEKAREAVLREVGSLEQQSVALRQAVTDYSRTQAEDSAFAVTVATVEALLSTGTKSISSETLGSMRALLGGDKEYLMDLSSIRLWNASNLKKCNMSSFIPSGLQKDEVVTASDVLKTDVQRALDRIRTDESASRRVDEWIFEHVANVSHFTTIPLVDLAEIKKTGRTRGSSLVGIQNVIRARLEVELADRTGKVDYALFYHGARVIKKGPYATSPSLVDRLPYVNRLAASLSLRFHGFGPEIALMPTHPTHALGQCWSFLPEEGTIGNYATFTVRLAKPIHVDSLSIEHPPKEVNDRAKAAVRKFRVFGFENEDATGKAWELGSFEYVIGRHIIQEFPIEEDIHGVEPPVLRSISLAIDSNWGMQYTCLYRLRVHGEEEIVEEEELGYEDGEEADDHAEEDSHEHADEEGDEEEDHHEDEEEDHYSDEESADEE